MQARPKQTSMSKYKCYNKKQLFIRNDLAIPGEINTLKYVHFKFRQFKLFSAKGHGC